MCKKSKPDSFLDNFTDTRSPNTTKESKGCFPSEEKLRKISRVRSEGQERQLEIYESMQNLESKLQDTDRENLEKLKHQIAMTLDENMALVDDLSKAHETIFTLENANNKKTKQNECLNNELHEKDKELSDSETLLATALAEKNALHLEIESVRKQLNNSTISPKGNDSRDAPQFSLKNISEDFAGMEMKLIGSIDNVNEDDNEDASEIKREVAPSSKDAVTKTSNGVDQKTLVVVKERIFPAVQSIGNDFVDSAKCCHDDNNNEEMKSKQLSERDSSEANDLEDTNEDESFSIMGRNKKSPTANSKAFKGQPFQHEIIIKNNKDLDKKLEERENLTMELASKQQDLDENNNSMKIQNVSGIEMDTQACVKSTQEEEKLLKQKCRDRKSVV